MITVEVLGHNSTVSGLKSESMDYSTDYGHINEGINQRNLKFWANVAD